MINQDLQLKLQAYLDGELAEREAIEVRDWVARDTEAQALLAELTNTCTAMEGFETECRLPESREFFWSKIQREIERQEQAEARPVAKQSWLAWAMGHFRPLAGVAVICCVLGILAVHTPGKAGAQPSQLELASDDMGAYTFRDHNERMTMVWIYDKSADSQFTDGSDLASVTAE